MGTMDRDVPVGVVSPEWVWETAQSGCSLKGLHYSSLRCSQQPGESGRASDLPSLFFGSPEKQNNLPKVSQLGREGWDLFGELKGAERQEGIGLEGCTEWGYRIGPVPCSGFLNG